MNMDKKTTTKKKNWKLYLPHFREYLLPCKAVTKQLAPWPLPSPTGSFPFFSLRANVAFKVHLQCHFVYLYLYFPVFSEGECGSSTPLIPFPSQKSPLKNRHITNTLSYWRRKQKKNRKSFHGFYFYCHVLFSHLASQGQVCSFIIHVEQHKQLQHCLSPCLKKELSKLSTQHLNMVERTNSTIFQIVPVSRYCC